MKLDPSAPMGSPSEEPRAVTERQAVSNRFGTVTNLAIGRRGLPSLGTPKVSITAADGAARPSVSWPWTRSQAAEFVNAASNS